MSSVEENYQLPEQPSALVNKEIPQTETYIAPDPIKEESYFTKPAQGYLTEEPVDYASHGERFANWLLDSIFFTFFFLVFVIVVAAYLPSVGNILFQDENPLLFVLIWNVMYLNYYFSFEFFTGGFTMGKLLTRTVVVSENGIDPPTAKQIFIRTICRLIPFEHFTFIGNGVGLHDSLSKTRVIVRKRKY